MRIIFLFLSCLCFSQLSGQLAGFNYVPLEFKDLEPIWVHSIHDSTIINHLIAEAPFIEFDGYSHVTRNEDINPRFLIHEDAVITASTVQYNNDIGGAIIEKINLEDGELLWKIVFDLRTQDRREYVRAMRVEGDALVVYSNMIDEDFKQYSTITGSALGHLSTKVYDVSTGVLLEETRPDTTRSDLVLMKSPDNDSNLYFIDDTTYQTVWEGSTLESGSHFIVDTMTRAGGKISMTDTISQELDLDWEDTYSIHFMKQLCFCLLWLVFLSACECHGDFPEKADGLKPQYLPKESLTQISTQPAKPFGQVDQFRIHGDQLLFLETFAGIHVLDNTDPTAPMKIHFWSIPGITDFEVRDDLLYVDNTSDLVTCDVSDPAAIAVVSRLEKIYAGGNSETFPAEHSGFFECVDGYKGIVIDWEETELINPECRR